MLRHSFIGVVICLAAVGTSFAQEPPKPGPEHEKLKQMEGNWDTVMEAAGQQSKGAAKYKSINGGLWLASEFEGDLGGVKYQGHGLDGYDEGKKKFVSIWTDSMNTAPMLMEGDYDAKKKMVVFKGDMPMGDNKVKVKSTNEVPDKDHMTFKMYMLGADDSEQLIFTINYTRRK